MLLDTNSGESKTEKVNNYSLHGHEHAFHLKGVSVRCSLNPTNDKVLVSPVRCVKHPFDCFYPLAVTKS